MGKQIDKWVNRYNKTKIVKDKYMDKKVENIEYIKSTNEFNFCLID